MTIIVKTVDASLIPDLFRLLKAKAAFDGAEGSFFATEERLSEELLSRNPKASALLAQIGGETVGMATYFQTYSSFLLKPSIWLDDLYVDELHRKRGVGRKLIEALCAIAVAADCARIDWIVESDNMCGQDFYRNIGASIYEKVRLARLGRQEMQAIARSARAMGANRT